MDELDQFLLSDATSDEAMMLDCLDGYLTALATAPVMLSPGVWLPFVWGLSEKDEPAFNSPMQMERITRLIMKLMSHLIVTLRENPDSCEPIFDSAVYPDSSREFIDGEMWAYGYMSAVHLQSDLWQDILKNPEYADILRPIYLLGTSELTEDEALLIETPEQREALSILIPECVAQLYRFWIPVRRVVMDPLLSREMPKIGRNEKCPCGSGRKYKKCCGLNVELTLGC
jgi:uncharacterized protein